MSQLLSIDRLAGTGNKTISILWAGSHLPLFARRLSDLLEAAGQPVFSVQEAGTAVQSETSVTLRLIWIADADRLPAWRQLRELLPRKTGINFSVCIILAGGAFQRLDQHREAVLQQLQKEAAADGAGGILLLSCGMLTVDDAHVPEQIRIPGWLAPVMPVSATLPCLTARQLATVLSEELTAVPGRTRGGLRRLTIPGRRISLRQLLARRLQSTWLLQTAAALSRLVASCGATWPVSLLLVLLCRIGWSWTRLLPRIVKPRSTRELLEIYNRWSCSDLQLAGWNNGVVHFGWKFPGRTVISTSASGRCLRIGRATVTCDGGLPLKQVMVALHAAGRSLPVVPNFSWISMGTSFFVPVHGSGCRISTLGQAIVRVLLYDATENRLLRLHRDDREFQQCMYDRSRPLLLLRMTLQTQQPLKYTVREECLQAPTAEQLLLAFADPQAANVEVRKARAVDREVVVRRFDAQPAGTGPGELPRDRLGSLWDRIEETPLAGRLFHWFVRTFAFHVELLMSPDEFRIFWEHHSRLPLAKIQLRRMLRDGIENSACRDFDCICADLFMLRGKRHVFTEFIAEHLPAVRTNPGKQSL